MLIPGTEKRLLDIIEENLFTPIKSLGRMTTPNAVTDAGENELRPSSERELFQKTISEMPLFPQGNLSLFSPTMLNTAKATILSSATHSEEPLFSTSDPIEVANDANAIDLKWPWTCYISYMWTAKGGCFGSDIIAGSGPTEYWAKYKAKFFWEREQKKLEKEGGTATKIKEWCEDSGKEKPN